MSCDGTMTGLATQAGNYELTNGFPKVSGGYRRAEAAIFATGYGAAGLPAQFRDHAVVQKPFEIKAS
jgi:hypothetical protein